MFIRLHVLMRNFKKKIKNKKSQAIHKYAFQFAVKLN